ELGEDREVVEVGDAALAQEGGVLLAAAVDAAPARVVEEVGVGFDPALGPVDLADDAGAVAGAAELAEEGGEPARGRPAEGVVAVVVAVLAGEERDPTGGADRAGGGAGVEARALGGEPVEVRRAGVGMTLVAEHLGVVLVREDEEHVGAPSGGG